MLQIYKQNKKLFLTLIEKSFTERPSPLEIREEDKYLEKETLEKLKREEIDEMVEADINNFISSLDGDYEDALVDKNIDTKRKEQLQILINYINASTAIQEKFATDYTKIDIQKLWSAFNIVREARKKTQEVKKDVSNKNKLISEALSDAKNEKNPQEKVFKENAILAKIWYLKLENNTLNVSKSDREIAIKSFQKNLWIKETGIFDEQTYKIFEETFNPSEVWKTPEIKSNQAPANPIQNGEKPQETNNNQETNNIVKFITEFNLKKAKKEDIINLQKALNTYLWLSNPLKEDWIIWKYTKDALRQAKTNISSGISISKQGLPIVGTGDYEKTIKQVDKTKESVNYLKLLLEKTDELNERLVKYSYENKEGYSLEKLFEGVLWKDALDKLLNKEQQSKYDNLLDKGENKERLERAVMFLSSDYKDVEWEKQQLNKKWEWVLTTIKKALPWLGWIYLLDIPLSLTKTLIPWADINKSVAFEKWINAGMQGEFKEYYTQNKQEVDVVQNQNILIRMLSELKLSEEEKAKVLNGKLSELSQETQDLMKTYIAKRLIPDLKILQRKSYDAFERKTWYTLGWLFWIFWDKKYSKWKEIIKLMEEWLKTGKTDFEMADEVLELLTQENSKKVQWVLLSTKERNEYLNKVKEKGKVIEYINWLTSLGVDFQNLSILFYVKDIYKIAEFWLAEEDKKFFIEFFDKILKKDEAWLKKIYQEKDAKKRIQTIIDQLFRWGSKSYLLSQIKNQDWLEYVKVWKAQHGPSIKWLNGEKVYEKLSKTTTEKNWKTPSLGNVYKTFVENGFVSLSYSEFWKAIQWGKQVPIDEVKQKINNNPLINTAKNKGNWKLTTLNTLAEKWDKEVFALAPIQKTYTYYRDWKEITATVNYNLYLRSDCSNPLIVPADVKVVEKISDIKFNSHTYALVNGRLPIVIPWFVLFNKKPPVPEEKNSKITTTPSGWEAWEVPLSSMDTLPWHTWWVWWNITWQASNLGQEVVQSGSGF